MTGKMLKEHTPDDRTTDLIFVFSDHYDLDRCLTFMYVIIMSFYGYKYWNLLQYFRSDKRISHRIQPHRHSQNACSQAAKDKAVVSINVKARVAGVVQKLGTAPNDSFAQYDMVTSMIYLRKENI